MTAENFCYWLQGYFELTPNRNELPEPQIKIIREHLQLVFNRVTTTVETQNCLPVFNLSQQWEIEGNEFCTTPPASSGGAGSELNKGWSVDKNCCYWDGINPNYNPDYLHPLKTTLLRT